MEFKFNINHLFGETVSMVDHRVEPHRSTGENLKQNMEKVIDEMGRASAQAQGLHGPITSGHKLRYSKHHLYVMKDASVNGLVAVVGILKVGRKKLFVLDAHGNQIEMEPLCVLDFYVHESCQRRGCGKTLFQAMLQHEGIQAQHLPIDRPSHKFTSFLTKHYNLRATIHQVNNFVIFDGFFHGQPEESFVRKRSAVVGNRKPPLAPNKRDVPHSGYRNASNAALWSHSTMSTRRNSLDNPTTAQTDELLKDVLPSIGRSGSAGCISSRGSNNEKTRSSPVAANTSRLLNGSAVGGGLSEGRSPARDATPPFGRPTTFGLNAHLSTPTRDGHLKLSPIATSTVPGGNLGQSPILPGIGASTQQQTTVESSPSHRNNYGYSPGALTAEGNYCVAPQAKTMHSSWNIMGIPPSYQQRQGNGEAQQSLQKGSSRPW